jgi:asparagine synthase (glutamine-hydrolysing)
MAADSLPALLRYEDRNSMAFGLEARVPFLDHRLVEACMALPDRLRIDGEHRKVGLRRAMADVIPAEVLRRSTKVAFQAPERTWLRDSLPALRPLGASPRAEASEFLAPGGVDAALDAIGDGRVSQAVVWRVLMLEMWLRAVTDNGAGAVRP